LFLPSQFANELSKGAGTMMCALSTIYETFGVTRIRCNQEITVGESTKLEALSAGGNLLAVGAQDKHGSFCGKANSFDDKVVTCYPRFNVSCTSSDVSSTKLQDHN
jgi:hypothetical protein